MSKHYKVTLERLQQAEESAELKRREKESLEETERRLNKKHVVALELTHSEWTYVKGLAKINHMSVKGYLLAYVKKYLLREKGIGIGEEP